MYERITELPFLASTTSALESLISARRTREKVREMARRKLGIKPICTISFGRKGRTQIVMAMLLPYTRVLGTTPSAASSFGGDLEKYGVLTCFPDDCVGALVPRVKNYLASRSNVTATNVQSLAVIVNHALAQLIASDEAVRAFAETQRDRLRRFSRVESRFMRLPGQLVRVEGDEALVSIWNEARSREELRSLDASQVSDIGVDAEGDPLVVYEAEYIPGVRVSTVVPGIRPESDTVREAEDDSELRSYETPLPSVEELQAIETGTTARDNDQTAVAQVQAGREE
jgi:uncharacterized protein YjiS (DUF1127 family)